MTIDLIHSAQVLVPVRDPATYEEFAGVVDRQVDVGWLKRQIVRWMRAGLARLRHAGEHGDLWEFHLQMNCLTPWLVRYGGISAYGEADKPLRVDSYLRCRKCEGCMDSRARLWAGRAGTEFDLAARTYMATFTMSLEEHALLDVRVAGAGRWPDRSRLSESDYQKELFRARTAEFGAEITQWLNFARALSWQRHRQAGGVRYLLVAEAHDSEKTDERLRGRPHFHALLHETFRGALFRGDPARAIENGSDGELEMRKYESRGEWKAGVFAADKATARQEWQFGHTKFQLCFDAKSAFYLCKYMSKAMMYKVRASLRYGEKPETTTNEGEVREGKEF